MSNKKNTQSLGKGLGALFGESNNAAIELSYANETIADIPIKDIIPNPDQPRKQFHESSLQELAVSIKEFGIIQPLVVTKNEQKKYTIIAGERRWRAAKIAGLQRVPAIVRSSTDLKTLEVALIENVQREDLSPLDQALSIQRLHEQFSMTYEQIAARLGKAYSTVINIVRLMQLPAEMQQALREKEISEGHARALLSLQRFEDEQLVLFGLIRNKGFSVRQAEQYSIGVKERASSKHVSKEPHMERMASTTVETKKLAKLLGVQVRLAHRAKGGEIRLSYSSNEEYEALIRRLLQK